MSRSELASQGASATIDKGPDEMANYIKSETEKWGKVIKTLGAQRCSNSRTAMGGNVEFGQTLAEYVKSVTLDKIPQRDIDVAKLAILDQIGVALAGVGEAPGVKVQDIVNRCTANEATVLGTPRKTSTWLAALVNGTLGHTLDFDDCSSFGHPSVVLVPAMLATGETQDRSGRELLEAYIAGYEIGEALSRIVPRRADQFHGLHSTAMFGPLTSATVSGRLLGLNASQQRHAWGIAASQAGGITGNFGTHTKPLHGGIASQAGVMAAELAASGFEANPLTRSMPLSGTSTASSRQAGWKASMWARPRRASDNGISPIPGA